ncbi:MAG TPA: ABC transporter permease [Candidatus Polarisedimenticolia bacterium]|nr:ABC transporter permease [Candidatus Polarisedimenticolia bacterium]
MTTGLGESVRTSLVEIWSHKLRSLLTLLGIILGTLSITFMTSLLDGVTSAVWSGFKDLGFDGVMYVVTRPARDLREQAVFARSKGLQPEDGDVLLARGKTVDAVAPVLITETLVRRGNTERRVRTMGVSSAYNEVRSRTLEAGRFFSPLEEKTFAPVAVLGHRLNRRLFGAEDPVGKWIQVDGRAFKVIGVGAKLGNSFINDDDFVEEMEGLSVPLETLRAYYEGNEAPLSFMAVKTADPDRLSDLRSEAEASLVLAHHGAQDFKVQNIAEEMLKVRKEITKVLRNWHIVLGSIAGVSLLVGGIGLLSVMLISIGERLYEIGLRKSLGATDGQIFMQFLAESAILSLIGGLLGVLTGIGAILAVTKSFPGGLPLHFTAISISLGLSVVLGVLYGLYPAMKASRLQPVEALRTAL